VRAERFQHLCITGLTAPDIKAVDAWSEPGSRPYGLEVTFQNGSRLWVGITTGLAPGERQDQPEAHVSGDRLPAVPLPELYEGDRITSSRAEQFLASCIGNVGSDEIARVYCYTEASPSAHPGVGVECHSGARVFLPFVHTARPGQDRGREAYRLQAEF
jgi:hypothetical protein